ncbi:MAG TPA: 3-phosphoshikimate 1-carboxyvinyltransferase [Gammaproteobacteria bacterium]|jgi:3-phosphoshikimate 1-carboxyvinyltransferase|nr:3-phosphoshikimate 1-carboxyvinyltransferase [Gammaproteobacteria bacterium]
MAPRLDYTVTPGGSLQGKLRLPGDKSISHRALMLGAIAEGDTEIEGFLTGADCLATLAAIRAMGVQVDERSPSRLVVHGRGLHGLKAPPKPIDLGNSGTAMRLFMGLLAGQGFEATLIGDESLSKRPMKRVIHPLMAMGASIESRNGFAPITLHAIKPLEPARHVLKIASAQVKSALLLAGLYAGGYTWLKESGPSRDHTERMLHSFGVHVLRESGWLGVHGGETLRGTRIEVPADLSSAAFFMVGAAMTPGSKLVLEGVGVNPTRDGVIRILRLMGAHIEIHHSRLGGGEPAADILVQGGRLRGIDVTSELVALAIDDIPAVLVAAACAEGITRVHGAGELRVKESDRLQAMQAGLEALGVTVNSGPDYINVNGTPRLKGAEIRSEGDHRIAMAFAMAGLRTEGPLRVQDCANVDTSFPGFVAMAREAGLQITEQRA